MNNNTCGDIGTLAHTGEKLGKSEWEDALIKHDIMAAPEREITEDEHHYDRVNANLGKDTSELATKSMAELDILEDDLEEDVMKKYREKRIAELKAAAQRNKYGLLREIEQTQFIAEVSKASEEEGLWVMCHLYVSGKHECLLLNKCMEALAGKFKAMKFLKIVSTQAIPNYPDKNCPTILLYTKGDIAAQIIGLERFGGMKMTAGTLEWELAEMGALQTEFEEDPLKKIGMKIRRDLDIRNKGRRRKDSEDSSAEEDPDDW